MSSLLLCLAADVSFKTIYLAVDFSSKALYFVRESFLKIFIPSFKSLTSSLRFCVTLTDASKSFLIVDRMGSGCGNYEDILEASGSSEHAGVTVHFGIPASRPRTSMCLDLTH